MEVTDATNTGDGAPVVINGVYDYTTTYRLTGKWLKLFGINPFQYTDTKTDGNYLDVSAAKPLMCKLQADGYNMLYLHSNFGKSVSAASSAFDNNSKLQHRERVVWFWYEYLYT